jgi:YfiH family protein
MSEVPGVVHGFTERAGGASSAGQLNLAPRAWDHPEAVEANWSRAVAALHPQLGADALALAQQVHGASLRWVKRDGARGPSQVVGEHDGLLAEEPGVVLAVRTADCVPVLLADAGGAVVAAVHAGWRGAAAGIVPAAVRAMRKKGASEIVAAIGPCIGGARYEVGQEVVAALAATGVPEGVMVVGRSERGRPLVDVGRAVEHQLDALGVTAIDRHGACTFDDVRWWSHRRDGAAAGRQAALIARVPLETT